MKASESFSKRLSLKVVGSTITLVILTVTVLSIMTVRNVSESSNKIASSLLDGSIKDLDLTFSNIENAAINNIWTIKEHIDEPEFPYRVTWRLLETNPAIVGSTVAYVPDYFPNRGHWYAPYTYRSPGSDDLLSIQMGGKDYDYFSMEWFAAPLDTRQNCWSQPYFDDGGGEQLMTTFSVPIWNENHDVIAVFTADFSFATLKEKLNAIKPYKHSYAMLLDGKGNYIFHPDSSYVLKKNIIEDADLSGDKEFERTARAIVAGERGNCLIHPKNNSKKKLILSYGPLKNGWREAIATPFEDVYGDGIRLIILFVVIAVLCLILLYRINKLIISRESQPITEFTYAALNLSQGKFDAHIPEIHTDDEIKRLHDALHYLEQSISRYIRELKVTTREKERIDSELSIASGIQDAMLLKEFPDVDGLDIHAIIHPAKEVGGDLYDCFINKDWLYFIVGDVSGKGVPAALFMAITLSAFRFIAGMDLEMDEVACRINNAFSEGNREGMFVTLFLGRINLRTLEMQYCNAGHNPIITIDHDGKASFLHAKPNIAAGLFENFKYEEESLQLHHGSRLVFYTDGVSEAEKADKEQYGERRMLDFSGLRPVTESSRDFVSAFVADVTEFTSGAEQNDDITIMSIKL